MKSTEVYSQLRSEFSPWFKAAGFKRSKGFLSWSRPHGEAHLVVWCQISQIGWDAYSGSQFVVEFQKSKEPLVGASAIHRSRIASFLSQLEREEVRCIQNSVIAALRRPPPNYPILQIAPSVASLYLGNFRALASPYPPAQDIWFRYAAPEHIARWSQFILRKLPECVSVAEAWG